MVVETVGAAGCGAGAIGLTAAADDAAAERADGAPATAGSDCVAVAGRGDGDTALAAEEAALAAGADGVKGRAFAAGMDKGLTATGVGTALLLMTGLAGFADLAGALTGRAGVLTLTLAAVFALAGLTAGAAALADLSATLTGLRIALGNSLTALTAFTDFKGLAFRAGLALRTGLAFGATLALRAGLADAALALGLALLAALTAGLSAVFTDVLAAGLAGALAVLVAGAGFAPAFKGVLFFLAGDFTACLLWALACG